MTAFNPVHVEAHIDPELSRWQWLFKWLLAIPHYIVLAFLWLGFVVLSVVAFFAILFTGRYPRSIFDFNVGVLRWTWRVSYYAYSALGTDRYPPFSLEERPDYPAHLEVEYPEHLSRGLVLVKWWLLAIPHYLVVGLFLGGATWAFNDASRAGDGTTAAGMGLIGLLVLIAAVVLLFTGRYPQPIYDLVLGLDRWVLRVAAYASLMTDVYPPFRLDQGGDDPTTLRAAEPTTPVAPRSPAGTAPVAAGPVPVAGTPGHSWSAGRIVAVIAGSVVLLGSVALGLGGGGLALLDQTQRDDQGFLMSGTTELTTPTYAITSTAITLHSDVAALPESLLGDVKLASSAGSGVPVFVGIASTADVRAYLGDVEHATMTDYADGPVYSVSGAGAPTAPPATQDIWVASSSGASAQDLVWPVADGDWTVVVMNADGSRGVVSDVAVGATFPAVDWLVPTLLVSAAFGLVVATVLFAVAFRRGLHD